ncbi:hypothetical protein [Streptomyces sp. NPDC058268]|uniref:hypothetical protein n=1 Tax=Streptomyces sp. NPDC058268 TaxID=3346413 RepID=UPI0036E8F01A
MHRTTTAATLLASVAVTALSGCVSVERHPAPGPSAESAPPPAPRTTGTAPTVPAAPQRTAHPARHSDPPPRRHAHRPEAAEPPALPTAVPTTADLCALGKQYGGWQPGSPEATICQDAYGP